MTVTLLALFALGAVVQGADVSPVEKVITMLQDLQTQVITEGKLESKTYNTFACFCKDMSEEKNKAITDGQDSKGTIEGNLATLTSARDDLDTDISDLTTRIASVTKAIADAKAEREKDAAEYVVEEAEIHHASDSVKGALDMLEAQKKAFGAAGKAGLIQEQEEEQKKQTFAGFVRDMARIADKSDSLSSKKKKALATLLMSDDPMALLQADMAARASGTEPEETEFASGEIIEVVEDLEGDFSETLTDTQDTERTASTEHKQFMESKQKELEEAQKDLTKKKLERGEKVEKIGVQSKDLTMTAATLSDDQAYLQELTDKCNLKSKQWEQRSTMRANEITALTTAIHIVAGKVKDKTSDKRVRLVQRDAVPQVPASDADADARAADLEEVDDILATEGGASLLQLMETPRARAQRHISQISAKAAHFLGLPSQQQSEEKKDFVVRLLKARGASLKSATLMKLAASASADPFGKIRQLIQELVERLLQEAADEANHQGWCNKELGKAKQARDTKADGVSTLNSALGANEALRDKLMDEIFTLTNEVVELNDLLGKTTKERKDEKTENEATIAEAEEGKTAVEEAISVLEKFYKTAAKAEEPAAAALVAEQEVHLSRGPVDEDMPDAGFDKASKGSQSASKGILGMLDVILSDFVRTIATTEKEEKESEDEFMSFQTATKVSVGKKTVGKDNRDEQLMDIKAQIVEDNQSLMDEQALLDKSIQELIELQPSCVDTAMSYEERVQKRQEEIDSLKEALCVLDSEGPVQTESGCDQK